MQQILNMPNLSVPRSPERPGTGPTDHMWNICMDICIYTLQHIYFIVLYHVNNYCIYIYIIYCTHCYIVQVPVLLCVFLSVFFDCIDLSRLLFDWDEPPKCFVRWAQTADGRLAPRVFQLRSLGRRLAMKCTCLRRLCMRCTDHPKSRCHSMWVLVKRHS